MRIHIRTLASLFDPHVPAARCFPSRGVRFLNSVLPKAFWIDSEGCFGSFRLRVKSICRARADALCGSVPSSGLLWDGGNVVTEWCITNWYFSMIRNWSLRGGTHPIRRQSLKLELSSANSPQPFRTIAKRCFFKTTNLIWFSLVRTSSLTGWKYGEAGAWCPLSPFPSSDRGAPSYLPLACCPPHPPFSTLPYRWPAFAPSLIPPPSIPWCIANGRRMVRWLPWCVLKSLRVVWWIPRCIFICLRVVWGSSCCVFTGLRRAWRFSRCIFIACVWFGDFCIVYLRALIWLGDFHVQI